MKNPFQRRTPGFTAASLAEVYDDEDRRVDRRKETSFLIEETHDVSLPNQILKTIERKNQESEMKQGSRISKIGDDLAGQPSTVVVVVREQLKAIRQAPADFACMQQ